MPAPSAAQLAAALAKSPPDHAPPSSYAGALSAAKAGGPWEAVAAALNDRSYGSAQGPVPGPDLQGFAASSGLRLKLEQSKGDAATALTGADGSTTTLGAVCLGTLDRIVAGQSLDPTRPDVAASLAALVGVGFLSTTQKAALLALGQVPASWADLTFGVPTDLSWPLCQAALGG